MRTATLIGGAALTGVLGFAGLTLYALEGREVVVLRTHTADGTTRETRAWIADDQGASWIEAAVPERPFLQDLVARQEVEVERGGVVGRYRSAAMPNPDGHAHIRQLLAQRYGWADCWVGLLTDTTRSVEVRLDPVAR
jgi:hypothetical protein